MDEKERRQVAGIYEELKGVLSSFGDKAYLDDDGISDHINFVVRRVSAQCPDIPEVEIYLARTDHVPDRGRVVDLIATRPRLASLIGRIKGVYGFDGPFQSAGNTIIQTQNQEQSQQQIFVTILGLQERLISEIPRHAEGTKERGFLEKLKGALPAVKNVTDILASVLKIGGELGLDPATIHKLLGL